MARSNILPIDPDKLITRIKDHKITSGDLSAGAGHARNYCADCLRRKVITKAFCVYLESMGIMYDDIKPDPEPVKTIETPSELSDPIDETVAITMHNLAEVLSVAIYTAFANLHKDGII